MKHYLKQYAALFFLTLLTVVGCTGSEENDVRQRSAGDLYTQKTVMELYDCKPEQALQMVDSAVIMGSLSEARADVCRAMIYCYSLMGRQLDSLLGGQEHVRFDSARAVGERLLGHDSIKTNIGLRQSVLEVLVYSARQLQDTTRWLQRSLELVDICHQQGLEAEPEALRTEAEIGAAQCRMGQRHEGMARIDSVVAVLDSEEHRRFNWLDATVIAMKRKLGVLSEEGEIVQTIPLARRIIDRLDDYERHPDVYHDGTYREPADSVKRADYITFYRTQAQSFITAAFAKLGEQSSMSEAYELIERSVREATAREHIARYDVLKHQLQLQAEKRHSQMMTIVAVVSVISLLLILAFATYVYFQSRRIKLKNKVLVRQINQSLGDKSESFHEPSAAESQKEADDTTALFSAIDRCIRSERLYANANFQRQDVCERFNIRREVLNQLMTTHADGLSFPTYINGIRLSEACRLLKDEPTKTVVAIADEVGLSPRYLRRLFVDQYGVTPSEYRVGLQND